MKTIARILIVLLASLALVGCPQQKKEEKKSSLTYTPPAVPSNFEIDQLKQTAKSAPKSKDAWINLGNALMDTRQFNDAIEAYEKALTLDSKNVPVRVDLGTCYRGVGQFEKAVEQYRQALKIDPNFPNGRRNLGVVLGYDLHRNQEAIVEFRKYLELVPNAPDAADIRNTIQQLSSAK